jgi:hypothetical protein
MILFILITPSPVLSNSWMISYGGDLSWARTRDPSCELRWRSYAFRSSREDILPRFKPLSVCAMALCGVKVLQS